MMQHLRHVIELVSVPFLYVTRILKTILWKFREELEELYLSQTNSELYLNKPQQKSKQQSICFYEFGNEQMETCLLKKK